MLNNVMIFTGKWWLIDDNTIFYPALNPGSIFDLIAGAPKLGFGITASIALVGFPSFIFLFYAALLKGAAETEEDDKAFRESDKYF